MQQLEKILIEMEKILDLLIENAKQLLELSKQVIAEEELTPLQEKQQELLTQLLEKDDAFHEACAELKTDYNSPLRNRIDEKLDHFQKLNSNFIDNITTTLGLIQFEKGKIKKRPKQ